jgi:diguanylate cyclase (GGDEF)-like protein
MNEVMNQRNRYLLTALTALLILAIVFIAFSLLLIDRTIIRPINKLSDTSEKYWSSGTTSTIRNEFSQLQIHTGDEIETLSNSMKQMEQNINEQFTKILETTQKLVTTRQHADEMDRIANVDALTKVRNKRAYDEKAARLSEGLRTGEIRDFGIAMIDLNDLKKINDNYGHDKGDIAIQRLCGMICAVFKHSPVFRLGGDEFAVVLEGHDLENVEALMRQLEKDIDRNRANETLKPWERTSAAVGYARYSQGDSVESVFKRADKAMYARKTEMKAHVS